MIKQRLGTILILLSVFILSGCSKGFVPMSGRVTYSDDGSPLEAGTVCFATSSIQANGTIQKDGRYVLGSLAKSDGLPKGTYRVFIGNAYLEKNESRDGFSVPILLIDSKYTDPETSSLEIVVDGSQQTFDFVVDRAKK